jgi:hypothetical protein
LTSKLRFTLEGEIPYEENGEQKKHILIKQKFIELDSGQAIGNVYF